MGRGEEGINFFAFSFLKKIHGYIIIDLFIVCSFHCSCVSLYAMSFYVALENRLQGVQKKIVIPPHNNYFLYLCIPNQTQKYHCKIILDIIKLYMKLRFLTKIY